MPPAKNKKASKKAAKDATDAKVEFVCGPPLKLAVVHTSRRHKGKRKTTMNKIVVKEYFVIGLKDRAASVIKNGLRTGLAREFWVADPETGLTFGELVEGDEDLLDPTLLPQDAEGTFLELNREDAKTIWQELKRTLDAGYLECRVGNKAPEKAILLNGRWYDAQLFTDAAFARAIEIDEDIDEEAEQDMERALGAAITRGVKLGGQIPRKPPQKKLAAEFAKTRAVRHEAAELPLEPELEQKDLSEDVWEEIEHVLPDLPEIETDAVGDIEILSGPDAELFFGEVEDSIEEMQHVAPAVVKAPLKLSTKLFALKRLNDLLKKLKGNVTWLQTSRAVVFDSVQDRVRLNKVRQQILKLVDKAVDLAALLNEQAGFTTKSSKIVGTIRALVDQVKKEELQDTGRRKKKQNPSTIVRTPLTTVKKSKKATKK